MAYTFLLSSAILVFCLIIVGHMCFLKYPNLLNTLSDKINRRRERYRYEAVRQEDPDEDQQLFRAAEDRDRIVDLHNNTLSRRRRPTTVRSNDTLVDAPFQLISGFFHVNQGV